MNGVPSPWPQWNLQWLLILGLSHPSHLQNHVDQGERTGLQWDDVRTFWVEVVQTPLSPPLQAIQYARLPESVWKTSKTSLSNQILPLTSCVIWGSASSSERGHKNMSFRGVTRTNNDLSSKCSVQNVWIVDRSGQRWEMSQNKVSSSQVTKGLIA